MKIGDKVKVWGKNLCTITALSTNGKRALVTGDYDGWTNLGNCKAAA